jgi:hypothetical protein
MQGSLHQGAKKKGHQGEWMGCMEGWLGGLLTAV